MFVMTGFNECLGSTDEIHVGMLSCSVWAKINYVGHELKTSSRSCDATVTHVRQTLGTTSRHPATWNDKPIISCDKLIRGVHEGKFFLL